MSIFEDRLSPDIKLPMFSYVDLDNYDQKVLDGLYELYELVEREKLELHRR